MNWPAGQRYNYDSGPSEKVTYAVDDLRQAREIMRKYAMLGQVGRKMLALVGVNKNRVKDENRQFFPLPPLDEELISLEQMTREAEIFFQRICDGLVDLNLVHDEVRK